MQSEEECIALVHLKILHTEKIRKRQEGRIAELTTERDEINRNTRQNFEKLEEEAKEKIRLRRTEKRGPRRGSLSYELRKKGRGGRV